MVQLSSGGRQWTGVMIRSTGRILTTSGDLGASPLADFTIGDVSGQAWVIGRNDDFDLAVLDVIDPQGPYPFVTLKSAPGHPLVNETFTLLQFSNFGSNLITAATSVLSLRPDRNGIQYIQLQTLQSEGSQGGALVDGQGVVRGLRMSRAQMLELFDNAFGEWAMESQALANQLVPRLEAGISVIDTPAPTCGGEGPPPPRPGVFRGRHHQRRRHAPCGQPRCTHAYAAAARKSGTRARLATRAATMFPSAPAHRQLQSNATVEFWYDRMVAPQTAAFVLQTS